MTAGTEGQSRPFHARRKSTTLIGGLIAMLLSATFAHAADPQVTVIRPKGAKQGSEVLVTFYGSRLADAESLYFFRPGISVLRVERRENNRVGIRLKIDETCPMGEHQFRLRTKSGVSGLVTFFVGALAEAAEKEPNNGIGQANAIALGTTVNGTVQPEDVDFFKLDIAAGQRIQFEVQGVRLGFYALDPHLTIYNAGGHVLLESDDSALGRMDPACSMTFDKAGAYFVEVRESAYGGNGNAAYRLHIGEFERPLGVVPCGGKPGETIDVTYLSADSSRRDKVRLPKESGTLLYRHFPTTDKGTSPTPVVFRVSPLNNVIEAGEGKRTEFQLPAALHGVIGKPKETDIFTFDAKKGQNLEIIVLARRMRSPLDPVIIIRDGKTGRTITSNDDSGHPDSLLRWRVPNDGKFRVDIRDHLQRGSHLHFYRIEIGPRRSAISARVAVPTLPNDVTVSVPQGGRMATYMTASGFDAKKGFELNLDALPDGVSAKTTPFQSGITGVPVLLEATVQAPIAGSLAKVGARYADKPTDPNFLQVIPLVRVRNNQVVLTTATRRLPVAVTEPAPFIVHLEAPSVPLVRNAPMSIKVRVERKGESKLPIQIRMLWVPPGVGAGRITIPGDKSEGHIPMNANSRATIGTFKMVAIGTASVGGGRLETSSQFVDLEVCEPWVNATLGKVRTDQGKNAEFTVKLTRTKEFKGSFEAELLGLPRGITTKHPKIDQDTKEIVFPLTIDPKAPTGRHRRSYVRLQIPANGSHVVHQFYGGEVRIDKPLPPRAKPAVAVTKKPSTKKPPAKKPSAKTPTKGTVAKPKT
ncbi:MAG: pre-peptidase C-terminal domain-containing protein [Planctomycetota bacterium]|nr:pre-peptidase C-terminal domain-containing protein [Planctomycetota bacterium]